MGTPSENGHRIYLIRVLLANTHIIVFGTADAFLTSNADESD